MMPAKPIKILGKDYFVRFPTGRLIMAEEELGINILMTISGFQSGNLPPLGKLAPILRYGIQTTSRDDEDCISKEEFAAILNSMDITDFSNELMVPILPEIIGTANRNKTKPSSGKNLPHTLGV